MAKRVSVFYTTKLSKNEATGGAWLLQVVKKDREGEVMSTHLSAWKGLPAAKREAVTYIGKRPKWEVNEANTKLTAETEVRVVADNS